MEDMAMGQNPLPPVNIPIPTKIGSKMSDAHTPKWYHWFDPQPYVANTYVVLSLRVQSLAATGIWQIRNQSLLSFFFSGIGTERASDPVKSLQSKAPGWQHLQNGNTRGSGRVGLHALDV